MAASTTVLIVVVAVTELLLVAMLRSRARYKSYRRSPGYADRICSCVTAREAHGMSRRPVPRRHQTSAPSTRSSVDRPRE